MATLPHPVPPDLAELIAGRLRVIGDPTRIRILDALRSGEQSVGALTDVLQTSQQNASKHLGVLHAAGVVSRRKDGTTAYYRVVDAGVFGLCELVCGGLQHQADHLSTLMEATR